MNQYGMTINTSEKKIWKENKHLFFFEFSYAISKYENADFFF